MISQVHTTRMYTTISLFSLQERMTLMSPGVSSAASSSSSSAKLGSEPRPFVFPPRQLTHEPSVESDGYSEVFDGEDLSENSLPSRLTGLMSAPFTSDSAQFCLRKPPVHSTPSVQPGGGTSAVPGRLSLVRADSWSVHTRRGSLKVDTLTYTSLLFHSSF